jgi:hypothetical protein
MRSRFTLSKTASTLAAQWRLATGMLKIKSRAARGTVVNADEAASCDALNAHFEMKRIYHSE